MEDIHNPHHLGVIRDKSDMRLLAGYPWDVGGLLIFMGLLGSG